VVKPLLASALQSLHGGRKSIALELESSSQAASYLAMHLFGNNLANMVREILPQAALTPCEGWIEELKSVKTRSEIETIRVACGIARSSFETGATQLRAGMHESEAAELFRATLRNAKRSSHDSLRSDGFAFCMSGTNAAKASAAYARTRDRVIERGDTVMIHCNSYVNGFWTDITRTYTFQPADERQDKMRTAVLAARDAALECIKPGVRAAEVDSASRNVIMNFGMGTYLRHGTGHGVGFSPMSAYSIPRVHMKSPDVLREGMVFNVEPAVYVDDYGGIRHCDMVAVTGSGYELLTDFQSRTESLTLPHPDRGKPQFVASGATS
jgi:Xaa-Pro aminopeptidase